MNIAGWLAQTARADPSRPALFHGTEQVATYGAFHERAIALAGALAARGVQPGAHVALFMTNTPEVLIVLHGIWSAGAVAVPINAKLHAREAAFILAHSESVLVFATPLQADALREVGVSMEILTPDTAPYVDLFAQTPLAAPVPRAPSDLAWLFYTSGTTGQPKGVMITHGMLLSMSLCYPIDVDCPHPEDATLYAAPMSHGAGLYALVHIRVGARHVCPASGGFDPAEILDLSRHFARLHMFAAPTMVTRLTRAVQQGLEATEHGLRTVVYAGGPMYTADIMEATERFGDVFVQIYGQGECPMGITALSRSDVADRAHPNWHGRLSSVGRAQAAVQVRIVGPDGQEVPAGAQGEILVRGATVMPGYWRDPDATARALTSGWLMTGDIGAMDDAGYLTLTDRSKDLIISGGSNVYPREVEEVLLTHPRVEEASVVGRAHPDWGEEVVAFVVGTATDPELEQHCRAQIARFKCPKAFVRIETLPKNNYGKVLKTVLRELLADQG